MNTSELRTLAESKIELRSGASSADDPVIHELEVHQLELEIQNEELRRAQLEAEEARDRYLDLYELSPVGYLTVDRSGRMLEANRSAETMVGVPKHELIGRAFQSILSEVDADCFYLHLRRVFELKSKQRCEVMINRADGTSFPALLDSIVMVKQAICLTTIVDLTEKRKAEAELREAVARFHQLTEQIEDVFFICEHSTGRILYLSPAFTQLMGMDPKTVLSGRHRPIDWIHTDDRPRALRSLIAFVRGDPLDLEVRIMRPLAGDLRVIRMRAFPVPGQDRIAGMVSDVTDERALEEELRHAQKMEAVGALASGIAHDFNNLLMGVVGFATIALNGIDAAHPVRAHMKRVVDIATRGRTLTQQLLDFSRKRPSHSAPIELDTVVSSSKALLETLVGESIHVVIRCGAARCRVQAEPGEIERMLMNLATNARDSMPKGGTLLISTTEVIVDREGESEIHAGRYATLSVRDTGHGMDEETRRRIFEPFFTTKGVGAGTGLGLSTTFTVVRRMGGTINVETAPGSGTTFTIRLPVLPETSELMLHEICPRGEGGVLVVEDDPFVRESVAYYLASAGYEPLIAEDGRQAMQLVREQGERIRLLLTDVMMPHQLGRDLANDVRAELPGVSVVYMSAHPWDDLVEKGRIEADAILIQKPFDELRLALTLHKVMAMRELGEAGSLPR